MAPINFVVLNTGKYRVPYPPPGGGGEEIILIVVLLKSWGRKSKKEEEQVGKKIKYNLVEFYTHLGAKL